MVSRWRDRACFTRVHAKPASTPSRTDASRPDLEAAIELERLEHLHTYDVVAT